MGLDIDIAAYEHRLDDIGRKALPKAAAGTANTMAFRAKRAIDDRLLRDLDRPTLFTMKAFQVQKAKPGSDPEAEVYARRQQASYLSYAIDGDRRGWGMPARTATCAPCRSTTA